MRNLDQAAAQRNSKEKSIMINPPPRNYFMVERPALKDKITENLQAHHLVVLTGTRGIGKEELAKDFFYNAAESQSYDVLIWINPADDQAIKKAAVTLGVEGDKITTVSDLIASLEQKTKNYLLVLRHKEKKNLKLENPIQSFESNQKTGQSMEATQQPSQIPEQTSQHKLEQFQSCAGDVIYISESGTFNNYPIVEVETFSDQESKFFLQKRIRWLQQSNEKNDPVITKILKSTHNYPFLLAAVAETLASSWAGWSTALEEKINMVIEEKSKAIVNAITISDKAKRYLKLFSCFLGNEISYKLFKVISETTKEPIKEGKQVVDSDGKSTNVADDAAFNELVENHIISCNATGFKVVNPIFTAIEKNDPDIKVFLGQIARVFNLSRWREKVDEPSEEFIALVPHVKNLLEKLIPDWKDTNPEEIEVIINLRNSLGTYFLIFDQAKEAIENFQKVKDEIIENGQVTVGNLGEKEVDSLIEHEEKIRLLEKEGNDANEKLKELIKEQQITAKDFRYGKEANTSGSVEFGEEEAVKALIYALDILNNLGRAQARNSDAKKDEDNLYDALIGNLATSLWIQRGIQKTGIFQKDAEKSKMLERNINYTVFNLALAFNRLSEHHTTLEKVYREKSEALKKEQGAKNDHQFSDKAAAYKDSATKHRAASQKLLAGLVENKKIKNRQQKALFTMQYGLLYDISSLEGYEKGIKYLKKGISYFEKISVQRYTDGNYFKDFAIAYRNLARRCLGFVKYQAKITLESLTEEERNDFKQLLKETFTRISNFNANDPKQHPFTNQEIAEFIKKLSTIKDDKAKAIKEKLESITIEIQNKKHNYLQEADSSLRSALRLHQRHFGNDSKSPEYGYIIELLAEVNLEMGYLYTAYEFIEEAYGLRRESPHGANTQKLRERIHQRLNEAVDKKNITKKTLDALQQEQNELVARIQKPIVKNESYLQYAHNCFKRREYTTAAMFYRFWLKEAATEAELNRSDMFDWEHVLVYYRLGCIYASSKPADIRKALKCFSKAKLYCANYFGLNVKWHIGNEIDMTDQSKYENDNDDESTSVTPKSDPRLTTSENESKKIKENQLGYRKKLNSILKKETLIKNESKKINQFALFAKNMTPQIRLMNAWMRKFEKYVMEKMGEDQRLDKTETALGIVSSLGQALPKLEAEVVPGIKASVELGEAIKSATELGTKAHNANKKYKANVILSRLKITDKDGGQKFAMEISEKISAIYSPQLERLETESLEKFAVYLVQIGLDFVASSHSSIIGDPIDIILNNLLAVPNKSILSGKPKLYTKSKEEWDPIELLQCSGVETASGRIFARNPIEKDKHDKYGYRKLGIIPVEFQAQYKEHSSKDKAKEELDNFRRDNEKRSFFRRK